MAAFVVALFAGAAVLGAIPQADAQGSEPTVETGTKIFERTVYSGEKVDVKGIIVAGPDGDDSDDTDQYGTGWSFWQLDNSWLFDFPNWLPAVGEHRGGEPDQIEWDPPVSEVCGLTGFTITWVPAFEFNWDEDWCGHYDLNGDGPQTHVDDNQWHWSWPHMWFDAKNFASNDDWGKTTFGARAIVDQQRIIATAQWAKMARCDGQGIGDAQQCSVSYPEDYEGHEWRYNYWYRYEECEVVDNEVDCTTTSTWQEDHGDVQSFTDPDGTVVLGVLDPAVLVPQTACGTGLCTDSDLDDGSVTLGGGELDGEQA